MTKYKLVNDYRNVIGEATKQVVYHFTPKRFIKGMESNRIPNDDDALFVLDKTHLLKGNFKFPLTSHG